MIKYLKLLSSILVTVAMLAFVVSCNDYVQGIDAPIDDVADDNLNTPADVPFLITGVQNSFSVVWDETSCFAGGLSDELGFSRDIKQATFPTFEAIDMAEVVGVNPLLPQNNSTEGIYDELCQLRLYADTLIERINNRITFTAEQEDIKMAGLYTAYFFGAVSRFMWGAYWSLDANDGGGGIINVSPYIPANDMYNDALLRLDQAILNGTEIEAKYAYTLKARIYLLMGNYTDAKTAADMGLAMGDPGFSALYNTVENDYWYYWSGPGRTQFHANSRFNDYITENAQEAARVVIYTVPAADVSSEITYYQQNKYNDLDSPIEFLSWQENHLMKAELAIRADDEDGGLALINEVRSFYGIDELLADDVTNDYGGDYLELLYVERDKTLCFTGLRLLDQRRFDKWHLAPDGTWRHFPISYEERQVNPNID